MERISEPDDRRTAPRQDKPVVAAAAAEPAETLLPIDASVRLPSRYRIEEWSPALRIALVRPFSVLYALIPLSWLLVLVGLQTLPAWEAAVRALLPAMGPDVIKAALLGLSIVGMPPALIYVFEAIPRHTVLDWVTGRLTGRGLIRKRSLAFDQIQSFDLCRRIISSAAGSGQHRSVKRPISYQLRVVPNPMVPGIRKPFTIVTSNYLTTDEAVEAFRVLYSLTARIAQAVGADYRSVDR